MKRVSGKEYEIHKWKCNNRVDFDKENLRDSLVAA